MEPPRRWLDRLIEFCVTLAVCAFLLRLAMRWVVEAAPFLLASAVVIFAAVLGYRLWKHMRNGGKW